MNSIAITSAAPSFSSGRWTEASPHATSPGTGRFGSVGSGSTHTTQWVGGLVLSAIKRDRGVKDWGDMITGHGGVLDRLDSTCFAAPIFFHVVRFALGG